MFKFTAKKKKSAKLGSTVARMRARAKKKEKREKLLAEKAKLAKYLAS